MYASDENGFIKRQEAIDYKGIRNDPNGHEDACEQHDPCQHSGICIDTDSGPQCDCRALDYESTFCEKGNFIRFQTFFLCSITNYPSIILILILMSFINTKVLPRV